MHYLHPHHLLCLWHCAQSHFPCLSKASLGASLFLACAYPLLDIYPGCYETCTVPWLLNPFATGSWELVVVLPVAIRLYQIPAHLSRSLQCISGGGSSKTFTCLLAIYVCWPSVVECCASESMVCATLRPGCSGLCVPAVESENGGERLQVVRAVVL